MTTQKAKVAILLASYNGEKYIKEQINSIVDQSYQDWELFIRDDGSTDRTVQIIDSYAVKNHKIHRIEYKSNRHGACINFYCLMRYAQQKLLDYDCYMLSDQDDIWERNKIEVEVKRIFLTESDNDEGIPVLVYSNLALMFENGKLEGRNMSDLHNIELVNYPDIYFNQIFVWGNTTAFNSTLLNLMNIPEDISNKLSHDHYLTFYAAAFGKVVYIDDPLVRYRRHADNVSGLPPKYNLLSTVNRALLQYKTVIDGHIQSFHNVLYFIDNANKTNQMLNDIKSAISKGGLYSIKIIKKYNICPGSNKENRAVNIYIMLFKKRLLRKNLAEQNSDI